MDSICTPEERKMLVSEQVKDLNYIYKYPKRTVSPRYSCIQTLDLTPVESSKGAFRSPLVLNVYSLHLRKLGLPLVTDSYGYQIGALALAAAAVCQHVNPRTLHNYMIENSTPLGRAWVQTL